MSNKLLIKILNPPTELHRSGLMTPNDLINSMQPFLKTSSLLAIAAMP